MSTHRLRQAGAALFLAVALGAVAFVGHWVVTGGRWFVVQTPSMGTSAPVGTLLWVKPVPVHSLHVGEFITFHPPGTSSTYSHRVYAIHRDGTISTKGQITSPDPWRLHGSDIVGAVQMRWWGVGWLVRAAPILLIGGLVLWFLITRFAAQHWRLPLGVTGGALVLCISIVVVRPLTGAVQLGLARADGGGRATYISTGLLPLRLAAADGGHVDLRAGEVGSVVSRHADSKGNYPIDLHPHITWWWWLALVALCFVPALWTLAFGSAPKQQARHRLVAA